MAFNGDIGYLICIMILRSKFFNKQPYYLFIIVSFSFDIVL